MKNDQKATLISLVRLYKRQSGQKPFSVTYLAGRPELKGVELSRILEELQQDGLVSVQRPNAKTLLVQPTLYGREVAEGWERERKGRSLWGRLSSSWKIVAGVLLPGLVYLVMYWLGLVPETSDILPLRARVPIRVYEAGNSLLHYPPVNTWYELASAPGWHPATTARNAKEADKILTRLMPEEIPSTLDGQVTIWFDIENIAPSNQVDVDKVQVEVSRSPVRDIEDLYFPPPPVLGVASWRNMSLP